MDYSAQATQIINDLNKAYRQDSALFDFTVSQYMAGNHNKELRREIMRQVLHEKLPLSKCGMYAVSNVLQNHFKQLPLF